MAINNKLEAISLAHPDPVGISKHQKIALAILSAGVFFFLLSWISLGDDHPLIMLFLSFGLMLGGGTWFFANQYLSSPPGIRNHGIMFSSINIRGILGWMAGILLTLFYIFVYFYPHLLHNLIAMVEPVSQLIRGSEQGMLIRTNADGNYAYDQWFLYGFIYTVAVLIMGIRAILKYRHSRYQIIRTFSVMFFQLAFAFSLPFFFEAMSAHNEQYYISYFWPLKYDALFPSTVGWWQQDGYLGQFVLFWTMALTFVATPFLTYFFGKRWYCSWVCGCGGLAETAGDPFRHLSSKKLHAWQIERYLIYSILALIVIITGLLWIDKWAGGGLFATESFNISEELRGAYALVIGMIFSGVIGVGFYPLLGSRVWCRFGCPMAAILGIQQKYFSRFRITTNDSQCISCGNCSTYCEMGIDVRWYAQRKQNIIRASCVGCGVCSEVCPRGVLKLENGPVKGRFNKVKADQFIN